jgi:hypothetical protein
LLLALVAVETFAVVHPLDFAAHPNGEPCKICVGVASLGAAAVSAPPVFTFDSALPELVSAPALPRSSVAPLRPSARGPPLAS